MCGITGIWGGPVDGLARAALARAMNDAISHRGPDGEGHFVDDAHGVALAHRRLSIVDLSPSGAQPMRSASGRYTITFNGEVYNFQALRRELEAAGGVPWRGHSDTEVMLAAIEAWGLPDAVRRFVGMFAFALWDRDARLLHLVRDRLGIKPLHYTASEGGVAFSSELKALELVHWMARDLDEGAIADYLRVGYVGGERCVRRAVRKLEPGCIATFDAPGAAPNVLRYWDPTLVAQNGLARPFAGDLEDATDALEALLRDAIGLRMIADVPLGAFLSGGIDSSTVVALMQAQASRPVRTFSIGNTDATYDESDAAAAVARHLGTEHTALVATSQDALSIVPWLVDMYDEPFADSSQIPTHMVSRLSRASVTVALSGDGGDEVFGGYNRHVFAPRVWSALRRAPRPARRALARWIGRLPTTAWNRLGDRQGAVAGLVRSPGGKVRKVLGALPAENAAAFYASICELGVPVTRPATTQAPALEGADLASSMMLADLVTYLPGDILTKVDRASMAVALEARVPLLDHRVVELAWSFPVAWKIRGGTGKRVLRRVLDRHVPRALVDRPKTGFGVPLAEWLRGPLRSWADGLLEPSDLARWPVDVNAVRAMWERHQACVEDHEHALWVVLMLRAWEERKRAR